MSYARDPITQNYSFSPIREERVLNQYESHMMPASRDKSHHQQLARLAASAGYGLIELLSFMAIFAVLLAAGLPHVDSRREDIGTSMRRIGADIRWTRSRSMTAGDHFAFRVTGTNTYQIERMQLVAGNWTLDEIVKQVEMPSYISISGFSPDVVEFDTRGMVVFAGGVTPSPWSPQLIDTKFSASRNFKIWPSGQFYAAP
jgi:hypothetical protein